MADRKNPPEDDRKTRQYMPVTDTPSQQGTGGRQIGRPLGSADDGPPPTNEDGRITTDPNDDSADAGIRERIKNER